MGDVRGMVNLPNEGRERDERWGLKKQKKEKKRSFPRSNQPQQPASFFCSLPSFRASMVVVNQA